MVILWYDFYLICGSENRGTQRLSHASFAMKASLLSGRNFLAFPLPVGGKIAGARLAAHRSC